MTGKTFGTAVNCMDGRVQDPVSAWLRKNRGVDYVDAVTEAGINGVLAADLPRVHERIRRKVEISIQKHGSKHIVVAGHHDCAGNPVSREEHEAQLRKAVELVKGWKFDAEVISLWVNENWEVEVLSGAAATNPGGAV